MPDQPSDPVDDLVDRYLDHLDRGQTPPTADELPGADQAEATATLGWLRDLWRTDTSAYAVPDLVDDPAAARVGLVPEPQVALAGTAVAAARRQRGLDLAGLAALVGRHGVAISIRELSRLERAPTTSLSVAAAQALASALGVAVDVLSPAGARPDDRGLSGFLASAAFHDEVDRWADRHAQEPRVVAARARELLRSVRFRDAGQGSAEQWLALLRTVLDDLA